VGVKRLVGGRGSDWLLTDGLLNFQLEIEGRYSTRQI